MRTAIVQYCSRSGQVAPNAPADFVQTIIESLALRYRYVVEALESLTGVRYDEIRVVGGGARNRVLNQFTADATGCRVVAGPIEATALGNVAMQMVGTGAVANVREARDVIDRSFPTEAFEPHGARDRWDEAYNRLMQMTGVAAGASS
jgi:sugar (pentulose or hexulose) kinase